MPDRSRFPSPAPVQHHDCRFIESRIRVRANSMRQMMLHKTKSRFGCPEVALEKFRSAALMPRAQKMHGRGQHIAIGKRKPSRGEAFQVMTKPRPARAPPEAHFIKLIGPYARGIKARLDGQTGKTRVMLHTADSFFSDGEY